MKIFKNFLGLTALALIFSTAANADTLELQDGRVLQGKFLGGTRVIVRFEVDGDVQTFRVNEISALSFDRHSRRDDRRDDGAPPPNEPSDAPPPPDQSQPNGAYSNDAPPNDVRQNGAPSPDQSHPDDNPPSGQVPSYDRLPPAESDRARDDRDRGADRDRSADRDRTRDNRQAPQWTYAAPGTTITLPAGQPMLVRMIDEIDSKRNEVGDVFKASLETDLVINNVLVARRGTNVYGRLAYVKEAGHLSGSSELQLELTRVIIDGREFSIVSGDYTLKGRGRGEDTARKVGGGAVAGAIIGAIAGGGSGAAIGAGVGGAAGAGVQIFTRGHQVKVPSETLLEFRLDQPVNVTPTQK
jgi:hypothetical protein